MKPEELKEIIICILNGKEVNDYGTALHKLPATSTIKLSKIFKCPLAVMGIDLNLHKVISNYPELFSLYGISNTAWNTYYNGKVVYHTFK